jgi:hypothetical protein
LILPEAALFEGASGRFGRSRRFLADESEIYVFIADQASAGICISELATRASSKLLTNRSLEIAIFLYYDRGVYRPPGLAVGAGRRLQSVGQNHVFYICTGGSGLADHETQTQGDDETADYQAYNQDPLAALSLLVGFSPGPS